MIIALAKWALIIKNSNVGQSSGLALIPGLLRKLRGPFFRLLRSSKCFGHRGNIAAFLQQFDTSLITPLRTDGLSAWIRHPSFEFLILVLPTEILDRM